MTTTYQALVVAILVLVILQFGLIFLLARYIGNFMNKIRGFRGIEFGTLEVGDKAPTFRKHDYQERPVVLSQLVAEKKTVLMFVNTDCPTCKSILPQLGSILSTYDLHLIMINKDNQSNDEAITSLLPESVLYLRSPQIVEAYEISKVPFGVLINQQGIIEQHSVLSDINVLRNMLLQEKRLAS
ncbi:redoxin domain-containing protein [Tumebacillus lipolyticus]|uniref:Redoxin domain-containing protein n=1 Tax=Tumebacillus lipolyticus TaxID=1280370 RepID=A0ABW4ZXM2_9BACL